MPNLANIDPQWLDVPFDPGRKHSIPYQWGSTSFSVNRDVYKGDISSLGIIFDPPPELQGKINVLDSQNEVLILGSLYLGIPQCTTDREQLKALNDMLLTAKPHWASFGSDTAKDVLVSGDAAAGMIYNGFSAKARAEGRECRICLSRRKATSLWMDNVVLLKDAPNRDNALEVHELPAGAGKRRRRHQLRRLYLGRDGGRAVPGRGDQEPARKTTRPPTPRRATSPRPATRKPRSSTTRSGPT